MIQKMLGIGEQETEEHWVSISDVMAGLMVIFLFIAISYMVNAQGQVEKITKIQNQIANLHDAYRNLQAHLAEDLRVEFEKDLTKEKWRGNLDMKTLSIRFKKPFLQGKDNVPADFRDVLDEFFPRYIAILTKPKYKNEIDDIRMIQNKKWIKENLTANGLSSSKLICDNGKENKEESRRVEFRVVTKSEKLINEIKRLLEEFNKAEGTN
jgi:outer membrane protein OmpA-like peptidoglycan-associated protein